MFAGEPCFYFVFIDWIDQAMDDALVGRCPKPKKGDQGLCHGGHHFLFDLHLPWIHASRLASTIWILRFSV